MKYILKHKMFIGVLIFVILIVLFSYFSLNKPSGTQVSADFFLTSTTPSTNELVSEWSIEPIRFNYNLPVDPSSVQYVVQPQTETKTTFSQNNPNQFSIVPLEGWIKNQKYIITIIGVKSISGEKAAPHSFEFTRVFTPPEEEGEETLPF
jgi:hypothetical protein